MSLVTIPAYLPQIHVPIKISFSFLHTDFSSPWWLLNRSLVRPQNQFGCYGEEVKYLAPNRELNQTWVQKIYQLIYPKSMSHLKFLVHFFVPISHVFVNLSSLTNVAFLYPAYLLNLNSFVVSGLSAYGVECVGGVACKRGTTDRGEGSYFSKRPKETFQGTRDGTRAYFVHPYVW